MDRFTVRTNQKKNARLLKFKIMITSMKQEIDFVE